jgi:hypothetical protein
MQSVDVEKRPDSDALLRFFTDLNIICLIAETQKKENKSVPEEYALHLRRMALVAHVFANPEYLNEIEYEKLHIPDRYKPYIQKFADKLIARTQNQDPAKQPNDKESITFFTILKELFSTPRSSDTLSPEEKIGIAKLALIANNLWEKEITVHDKKKGNKTIKLNSDDNFSGFFSDKIYYAAAHDNLDENKAIYILNQYAAQQHKKNQNSQLLRYHGLYKPKNKEENKKEELSFLQQIWHTIRAHF